MNFGIRKLAAGVVAVAVVTGPTGCGSGGLKTYPVEGRVELPGGDVAALAGSTVEAVQEGGDVRASGTIGPDGRFVLETLHAGAVKRGAPEGTYRARIVPADDDPATRRRTARVVAPRFLKPETAGLRIDVPAKSDVTLTLAAR